MKILQKNGLGGNVGVFMLGEYFHYNKITAVVTGKFLAKLFCTHPNKKLQLPATNMPDIKRNLAPTRGSCKSQNRALKLNLHL